MAFHNPRRIGAWLDVNRWTPGAIVPRTAGGSSIETRLHLESARDLPPQLRRSFEQNANFVFRSLRALGLRDAEVDDGLERVFVLAYRHAMTAHEPADRPWLYAACKRLASRRSHPQPAAAVEPVPGVDGGALAFGRELLDVLPSDQREVFLLYEVEELELAEIARALACSERTVRVTLHAARERIVAEVERVAAEARDD
jgi:RNA polymerase sigma-70 factor, ECF subfamily